MGTIISLYTSRLVLEQLGIDGFGVYVLVGSVVMSLSFLSNSLAASISRFMAFEWGKKDFRRINEIFNISLRGELLLGIFLVVILLTIGNYFIQNEFSIPQGDFFSAKIVLLTTSFSFFFTILFIPYKSAVIAREEFKIFAIIELNITVFKLIGVILLSYIDNNKLIWYSIIISAVVSVGNAVYAVYGSLKLKECRLRKMSGFRGTKELFTFASMDLFGQFCGVVSPQSLQWITNIFFGVVINAALGIANQVSAAINAFINTLTNAFRPSIIKEYASGNHEKVEKMITSCCSYLILLTGMILIPFIINTDYILSLWLKDVPAEANLFCQFAVLSSIPLVLNVATSIGLQATGKIKWQSVINGTCYLLVPVVAYIMFMKGSSPSTMYFAIISAYFLQWIVTICLCSQQIANFHGLRFFLKCFMILLLIGVIYLVDSFLVNSVNVSWMKLILSMVIGCFFAGLLLLNMLKGQPSIKHFSYNCK